MILIHKTNKNQLHNSVTKGQNVKHILTANEFYNTALNIE